MNKKKLTSYEKLEAQNKGLHQENKKLRSTINDLEYRLRDWTRLKEALQEILGITY